MHEMAIAEAIFDTVTARAEGRRVERVDVRIGYLRQVVPDALTFAWDVLTQESDLAGCALVVEHVPAVVVCEECGASTTLDLPIPQCGTCDGFAVTLVTGEEFDLLSFDAARA
jgi:hydrogenase nickel incorporation protein HypA/HybF